MHRMHIHLSVENLDESVSFYSRLFAMSPSVLKSDYAKWMLDDPRVNFAISQRGAPAGLNHLGIQAESDEELRHMHTRLDQLQSEVVKEEGAACCYAKSDKYWVRDPQGIAWETFRTLSTIPVFGEDTHTVASDMTACCIPPASSEPESGQNTHSTATGKSKCC